MTDAIPCLSDDFNGSGFARHHLAASAEGINSIAERLGKRDYPLDFGIIGEVVAGKPGTIEII